jgi:nitrite reductase (NADH) large subunit
LGAKTQALLGDPATGRVRAVRLEDGRELEAELVVMAVGIRPECSLARAAGLATGRGVLVDDHLATSDPRIDAVGECVEHRGQVFGLVAPLYEMAKVLAARLTSRAGETVAPFAGSDPLTKLKVSGIDLVSAGLHTGGEGAEDLVLADYGTGLYRKVVLRDGKLDGMVLLGDTSLAPWYFELMKKRTPVGAERASLLFGPSGGRDEAVPAVAMMGDDAEICGCNGVAKGAICAKIKGLGLASLDEVRAHTKASASCGSCTPLVQQLIALTAGEAAATAPARQGMCPCTEHGHDAVRAAIARDQLTSIAEVMRALDWKTQDGCHRCRPALNYYLTCARPGDYRDDPQSRFVNERLHANIQKDGTYSVVPRMWGGLTSPRELRAIADVAERYEIPTVKVTGGQRIDLLGVKREDLTKVWSDLNAAGMVSGHAYGKAVRTVKTCVGSEWCRFGVQDSTGLGVALERMTWGAWAPHKVKLGVSGCPRNCAEATIKDFGVVCVESGYELHVGGNGGTKVRVTDLLTKVRTADEALEYCAAFLQLYREEARYLERTAHWIERVGLAGLKARLVEDDAERQALAQRFHEAQRYAQHDPWAEAVQAEATRM